MEVHDLKKEEMVAIRRLSALGGAIRDAETFLGKIKVTTEEFVAEREKLVSQSIAALLETSKGMLLEIASNHNKVIAFANGVDDLSKNLENSYNALDSLAKTFLEYVEKSEKSIAQNHLELDERARQLKIQAMKIESGAEANRQRTAALSLWQTRLNSKEDSIKGALIVLAKKQNNA